jgi:hypothetical protein
MCSAFIALKRTPHIDAVFLLHTERAFAFLLALCFDAQTFAFLLTLCFDGWPWSRSRLRIRNS